MADNIDMSLDDLIKRNKSRSSPDLHNVSGSDYTSGPPRHFRKRDPPRGKPYSYTHSKKQRVMVHRYGGMKEQAASGTKLYVSNLHFQVSDHDIEILFSEVGELERYGIHYDERGKSKGSAEIAYKKESDALTALKRYNNLKLDGRPLSIRFIG